MSGAAPDNQSQNKRVESIEIACLDPGSTPGGSTVSPVMRGIYYKNRKSSRYGAFPVF